MIPIYEQGSGKGIGHSFDSFRARFDAICAEHLAQGRARSFAFIFYDFGDHDLREILKDQGAFVKLDRLAGTELSLFYLHTGRRAGVEAFNTHFLSVLGVEGKASLPCVVFFRVKEDKIVDIDIAQLESADLVHGFHELFVAIESYLKSQPAAPVSGSRAIRWLKVGGQFVSIEVLRAALKRALEFMF